MDYTLRVSRDLYVPRELVFEVWTQPAHLSGWYAPPGTVAGPANVDLRPGGAFRLTRRDATGAVFEEAGEYHVVDVPVGFRCSLCYGGAYRDHFCTELVVRLLAQGGTTRIEIEQSGFPAAPLRDGQRRAWPKLLEQMEAYFSTI